MGFELSQNLMFCRKMNKFEEFIFYNTEKTVPDVVIYEWFYIALSTLPAKEMDTEYDESGMCSTNREFTPGQE